MEGSRESTRWDSRRGMIPDVLVLKSYYIFQNVYFSISQQIRMLWSLFWNLCLSPSDVFISKLLLPTGQKGEAWKTCKKLCFSPHRSRTFSIFLLFCYFSRPSFSVLWVTKGVTFQTLPGLTLRSYYRINKMPSIKYYMFIPLMCQYVLASHGHPQNNWYKIHKSKTYTIVIMFRIHILFLQICYVTRCSLNKVV
jgi:hypothetical protein